MTQPSPTRPRLVEAGDLRPYLLVLGMAAAMWVVELVDLLPGTELDRWGIRPRQLGGLVGIATAPFLHAGFGHLIGNVNVEPECVCLGFIVGSVRQSQHRGLGDLVTHPYPHVLPA